MWSTVLYGHFGKYIRNVKSFDMWYYRRMEISWTDHVGIEVLQVVKEERSILQTIRRRQGN